MRRVSGITLVFLVLLMIPIAIAAPTLLAASETIADVPNQTIELPTLGSAIDLVRETIESAKEDELVLQAKQNIAEQEARLSLVATAEQYLGVPYAWGGRSPAGFDCSGLVGFVYEQAGIALPRSSYAMLEIGTAVGAHELEPGDIIFTHAGHVGVYAGAGMMIHSPTSGDVVRYAEATPFFAARRVSID